MSPSRSDVTEQIRPGPLFDPELDEILSRIPGSPVMDDDILAETRPLYSGGLAGIAAKLAEHGVMHAQRSIEGPRGEVVLSILTPPTVSEGMPAIYNIHGGGMVMGDRFVELDEYSLIEWVTAYGLAVITPEYGLAPESPAPAGVDDCYAGLSWIAWNAAEFGIDPDRIIAFGVSGGGGLAAGMALMARDHGGPGLIGQILICPQLDDRGITVSSHQYSARRGTGALWPRETNQFAWDAILGPGHEHREVSSYAAPSRATDLSGLPPTYLEVGSAEVFRDEDIAYASLLLQSGVQVELHVWPGAYHGFDTLAPSAPVSVAAQGVREAWVVRTLGLRGAALG